MSVSTTIALFLTTSDSAQTIKKIRIIQQYIDVVVIHEENRALDYPKEIETWAFSVTNFPFKTLSHKVVPGSTAYAAMMFLRKHSYDRAWLIEDDVAVKGGHWGFLADLDEDQHDFIGIDISSAANWPWRRSFRQPPEFNFPARELVKTLCCLCRISRQAAIMVTTMLSQGFKGHHEMLVPSLLRYLGLASTDLRTLDLLHKNTFRYRPAISRNEIVNSPIGTPLHPCKNFDHWILASESTS